MFSFPEEQLFSLNWNGKGIFVISCMKVVLFIPNCYLCNFYIQNAEETKYKRIQMTGTVLVMQNGHSIDSMGKTKKKEKEVTNCMMKSYL